MAVSFNVPKSPKRDVAVSDTFMGVDLTNTGANIDGFRSPNAENMIRFVPGKVRKRMGYYKDVLFGTNTNVNVAIGTSSKEREIVFPDGVYERIKLYDILPWAQTSEDTTVYVEFDYSSEKDLVVMSGSTSTPYICEAAQPDEEGNWPHYSETISVSDLEEVDLYSYAGQGQIVYIKNFSIMLNKDENYKWSPAPHHFVERETNDPVYGYHTLKRAGVTDGEDRIVNKNRVLKTHSEYDTFEIPIDTQVVPPGEIPPAIYMPIYRLAEIPERGTTVYVDFDYEYENTAEYMVYGHIEFGNSLTHYRLEHHVVPEHVSLVIDSNDWHTDSISVELESCEQTLKIKNLSVVYEKDENYAWSPAPEDVKEKFYFKDMFEISPAELTTFTSYEGDTDSSSTHIEKEIPISLLHSTTKEVFVSFDVTTSLTNSDAKLKEMTTDATPYGMSLSVGHSASYEEYTENFRKKHIEVCLPGGSTRSSANLYFDFYVTGGSTKAHISISNFSARECEPRTDYTVHSRWDLYHVGKDFYLRANDLDTFTKVYSDANEHISKSWQLNNKAYIIDGKDIYQFSIEDGEDVRPITKEVAYIPKVTIAKEPTGGGTTLEALNLLQPGFYELFQGKANVKDYQLSFSDLDDDKCKAWVMDQSGNWIEKEEDTDFTVNRETGKITFTTAPGVTPIDGEDNVKILAYRTVEGYRDRIVKCIVGTLFGVGGAGDRLFLTGNIDHPNWDFYSQQYDPTYFPDLGYSVLGSEQSKIMGYAIVDNYLTTFKDGFDPSQSVFVREGDMLKNEETGTSDPVFKLINTLQGEGVVAPYSFGYLQTEPLFLTKGGVYSITEQDITGQKYSQNRSFYLDGKLRKETGLEKAMAAVYDNQYILALNNKLYVLDGLQATRTDKSEPYATRQYAGFYCTNIPATCVWTDDALCFGTEDGRVCRFYTDEEALASYNDDGQPIYSCWETPDLDGHLFYKNKTFRYIAVRLMRAIKTSVKLYSRKLGVWTLNKEDDWSFIKEDNIVQNALNFEDLDFEMFTFSIDGSEKVVHSKLRVKKVDKARFRVENDKLNEPFGIFDIALEYIESGNYKG